MTTLSSYSSYIKPQWPAPTNVVAFCTTRLGGFSNGSYASFNLATHVGDEPHNVQQNRKKLVHDWALPKEPFWLEQTHSNVVIQAKATKQKIQPQADAVYTRKSDVVCAVLTADCLPILLCNKEGNQVAAIHAGWKGLASGIVENTIATSKFIPEQTLVWLGPAIGPKAFTVGTDVYKAFTEQDPATAEAFVRIAEKKWHANIYKLATLRLRALGIINVYGSNFCTYTDHRLFFSYRRDGEKTGRMASVIYFNKKEVSQ